MNRQVVQKWQVVPVLAEFGEFESNDGGELDINTTDYFPAGQREPEKLQGTNTTSDITLTRAYDPIRDGRVEAWFDAFKRGLEKPRVLVVQSRNQMGVVMKTKSYTVQPKNCTPPSGKAGDNSTAEIRVVLSVVPTV